MNSLISNLLMQPNLERTTMTMTDAVIERPQRELTLIEKLEAEIERCDLDFEQLGDTPDYITLAHTAHLGGLSLALKIAKQHQAESGWIACSERMPPNETMVMAFTHFAEIVFAFTMLEDNILTWCRDCSSDEWTVEQITHWMPMPQPPSEVQDDM